MGNQPCETSPNRRARGATLRLLRRNPHFRLLFLAQVVSFTGDWFLFVALAGLVFSLTHSPGLVAALYAAMTVPFTLFIFLGGPLADRLNRQALMILADVLRAALALGFFVIHRPSQVWLVYVLAGAIAALGSQIRRRFSERGTEEHEHPGLIRASAEAIDYARKDHRVLALLTVKGGFGLGAGVVALLPVLAFTVFHAGDRGTGILYGFR